MVLPLGSSTRLTPDGGKQHHADARLGLLSVDLSLGGALVGAIPIGHLTVVYLRQRPEIVEGGSIRYTALGHSVCSVSSLFGALHTRRGLISAGLISFVRVSIIDESGFLSST